MRVPRDPQGVDRAKRLRRVMTPPAHAMWKILRGHRLAGWKFTREISEGDYTMDFAARRERLGIELDGDSHGAQEEYDRHRTAYLEKAGWQVIRFTNREILTNPEGVSIAILEALEQTSSPRRGEGKETKL